MTSRLVVNSVRHTGASADAITLDASGNVTFPANATCSGTATGFGGGKVLQIQQTVIEIISLILKNMKWEVYQDNHLKIFQQI